MELVVRKTDLLRELQLFQGIVERKNTIPILANVLLEANGTEVKMLATDLEVGLRSKCPATISKPVPRSRAARKTLRPMRPNPLIATRTLIHEPPDWSRIPGRQSNDWRLMGIRVEVPGACG